MDDFLQELDEDVEGMQSTILFLQQELKTSKDTIQVLEREMNRLKSGGAGRHSIADDNNDDEDVDESERHTDGVAGGIAMPSDGGGATTANGNGMANGKEVGGPIDGGESSAKITTTTGLPSENEILKVSERILRKDKTVGGVKKMNEPPRTLRSTRSTRAAKNRVNGDVDAGGGGGNDDDCGDENGGEHNKLNNNKRTFDATTNEDDEDDKNASSAAESSDECSNNSDNEAPLRRRRRTDGSVGVAKVLLTTTTTTNNISNHKQLSKKVRRSSVLSLDLNEEDSRIDCGDDDRILPVTINGTTKTEIMVD